MFKNLLAVPFAIILLTSAATSQAQLAPTLWPMFHGDPMHTGQSTVGADANSGALKWTLGTSNQLDPSPAIGVHSSPVISADGTIYVGGDNCFWAVNPDGTVKWKFLVGSVIGFSSAAIGADGTIYLGSDDGALRALVDGGQGQVSQKWAFPTDGPVETSPAIAADGTVYFGSEDNNVYAVNPDGTLKWKFATGASLYTSSPAIGRDGTIYIGSFDQNLYALIDNGQGSVLKKWAFSTAGVIYSSPAIGEDGTIYFGSADHALYALRDVGQGSVDLKWSFPTREGVYSSPAIGVDGTIYIGSNDQNLYALKDNGSSAKEKWTLSIGGVFSSPAISADDVIFVGSENGNIYAIVDGGETVSVRWKYGTGGSVFSSPAIGSDGTIYIGSDDDYLYAVGIGVPSVAVKLKINPKSLSFGAVKSGHLKGPKRITITNPKGGKMASGLGVTMQGQGLAPAFIPFNVINECPATLPPGARCSIGITFAPNQTGPETGAILIHDNAEGAPQSVRLKGIGK